MLKLSSFWFGKIRLLVSVQHPSAIRANARVGMRVVGLRTKRAAGVGRADARFPAVSAVRLVARSRSSSAKSHSDVQIDSRNRTPLKTKFTPKTILKRTNLAGSRWTQRRRLWFIIEWALRRTLCGAMDDGILKSSGISEGQRRPNWLKKVAERFATFRKKRRLTDQVQASQNLHRLWKNPSDQEISRKRTFV